MKMKRSHRAFRRLEMYNYLNSIEFFCKYRYISFVMEIVQGNH